MKKENVREFYGYKVTDKGKVYSKSINREMKRMRINNSNPFIIFYIPQDDTIIKKRIQIAYLVYELFHETTINKSKETLIFKDGNNNNCELCNLKLIPKCEYHSKPRRFTEKEAEDIRKQYHESKVLNCNKHAKNGISIRDLAKKYNCSIRTIHLIVNNQYVKKNI